jgi:hypothetical protein
VWQVLRSKWDMYLFVLCQHYGCQEEHGGGADDRS